MCLSENPDKSLIPQNTFYCYELLSVETTPSGTVLKTRRCPFYKYKVIDPNINWQEPFCELFDETDLLLDDQVKICGHGLPCDGGEDCDWD